MAGLDPPQLQSGFSVNRKPPLQSRQPLPAHLPLYTRSERCTPRVPIHAYYKKLQAVCAVMCKHTACHPRHAQEPNTLRKPIHASQTTSYRSPLKLDLLGKRQIGDTRQPTKTAVGR